MGSSMLQISCKFCILFPFKIHICIHNPKQFGGKPDPEFWGCEYRPFTDPPEKEKLRGLSHCTGGLPSPQKAEACKMVLGIFLLYCPFMGFKCLQGMSLRGTYGNWSDWPKFPELRLSPPKWPGTVCRKRKALGIAQPPCAACSKAGLERQPTGGARRSLQAKQHQHGNPLGRLVGS